MPVRQIVAMGGGLHDLLDYVLGLVERDRPRLLWVGTASMEPAEATLAVHDAVAGRAEFSHLRFNPWPPQDLLGLVLAQDVVLVGGGNTANMLAIWRAHGFDGVLRQAWESGVVLGGSSAGMICWFECSVTDSFGAAAALHDGLGFLPGSACPHYDGEPERRPTYTRLVQHEGFPAGYAADDGAALHFVGTELAECVAARPGPSVYWVGPDGEVPLPTRVL